MFLETVIIMFIIATAISSFVVLTGKTKWERLLGSSLVSSKINMLIILFALITEMNFYLDIALIYIILSYVGVIVMADFMLSRRKLQ